MGSGLIAYTEPVALRLPEGMKAAILAKAEAEGGTLSTWIRKVLIKELARDSG